MQVTEIMTITTITTTAKIKSIKQFFMYTVTLLVLTASLQVPAATAFPLTLSSSSRISTSTSSSRTNHDLQCKGFEQLRCNLYSRDNTNTDDAHEHEHEHAHAHAHANDCNNQELSTMMTKNVNRRRQFLQKVASSTTAAIIGLEASTSTFSSAFAAEVEEAAVATAASPAVVQNTIEMKTFLDPKGLFAINVPKRFFAIRRTVKGDLPNEKTGQGRRGSSIFTAGDMSKAEVVAIERFPTRVLLEDEGIVPSGDLSTFSGIGNPTAIANLIALRRDRDKQTQARTIVVPNSVSVSADDKTLYFSLSQSIEVQKPELLMEQTGMSELVRVTLAKATLDSNDGQMMAVFASALQQDFMDVDGPALRECVDSFVALDQSQVVEKK